MTPGRDNDLALHSKIAALEKERDELKIENSALQEMLIHSTKTHIKLRERIAKLREALNHIRANSDETKWHASRASEALSQDEIANDQSV